MQRLSFLFAATLLSACAATGPAFEPPSAAESGYSTLIVYRYANGYGGAYKVEFAVNSHEKTIVLDEQGYSVVYLRGSGQDYTVRAGSIGSGSTVSFRANSGETYYIEYKPGPPPGSLSAGGIASIGMKSKNPLSVIPAAQASRYITAYKLQPALVSKID